MPAAPPKANPRLYTSVLAAIAELKEIGGSHIRTIIEHVQSSFKESTGKPRPRNVALQVRRAIQHGVSTGVLKQKGGRVRLSLGNKNTKDTKISQCCGFICKKKKSGKAVSKKKKGRGKHKSGGGDPCAPKRKGKRSRRSSRSGKSEAGKKRKRRSSSGSKGGSSGGCAPKRKKKVRRVKKKDCSDQDYSNDQKEEPEMCACQTCQPKEDQKNSHVSFADEDEICGDRPHCSQQSPDHIEKRRRSNQPPRRTSRQIRQGTPKIVDRWNHEFISGRENEAVPGNEHVPRCCNRNKQDYGVSYNQDADYINKNFDNNDIHGVSQECDNPDCLCNIKQEPVDNNEDYYRMNRDHNPERSLDRKRCDRDPDKDRDRDCDHDPDCERHRDPDRDRNRDPDRDRDHDPDRDRERERVRERDRDRNDRSSYFTN